MNMIGIAFPLLLLTVLLVVLLSYFAYYKRRINRVLEEQHSTAHMPMASMEAVGRVLAFVGAVIICFSLFVRLTRIEDEITNVHSNLQNKVDALSGQIDMLEAKLAAQNSLVSDFSYETGSYDPETRTCEVTFTCTLKTYTNDTGITLYFGEYEIPFVPEGGVFRADAQMDIFATLPEEGTLIVGTGDLYQTEQIDTLPWPALCFEALPWMDVYADDLRFEYTDGTCRVEATIINDAIERYTDTELIVRVNGAEHSRHALTMQTEAFSVSVPMEQQDAVSLHAVGVDEYGLTHEIFLGGWDDEGYWVELDCFNKIYDADGNLLFEDGKGY